MGKSIWDTRFGKRGIAQDDWITVHPNGEEHKGRHVEIDGEGIITKGLGGSFNGMHIGAFKRSWGEKGKSIGKRMTELRDAAREAANIPALGATNEDMRKFYSKYEADMRDFLNKVEYKNPPKALKEPMSEQDAIDRIAGGDLTLGSCASAAMAFIANQELGLDVRDFRDGPSRSAMSATAAAACAEVATQTDYDPEKEGGKIYTTNPMYGPDVQRKEALKALDSMHVGENYVACIGRHQAVVRKLESGEVQYLELQEPDKDKNGWQTLVPASKEPRRRGRGEAVLMERFGLEGRMGGATCNGVVPASRYANTQYVKDNLAFVNTSGPKQQKGEWGSKK